MNIFVKASIEALIEARNERGGRGVKPKITGDDIRSLRNSLNLSQREFSIAYGFDFESVRSWEKDRRHPDPINSVLLELIGKEPDAVRQMVLESQSKKTLENA